MNDDDLLNQDEVADMCKVSRKTISNWIAGKNSDFPKGFKLGGGSKAGRVWRRKVINDFVKSREQHAA